MAVLAEEQVRPGWQPHLHLIVTAGAFSLDESPQYQGWKSKLLFFELAVTGEVLMGLGMGVANAAVFKLVPQYVPEAVGGAAGWVGGLGAFGGFAVPPVLGIFVKLYGKAGYARGFVTFVVLAVVSLVLAVVLKANHRGAGQAAAATG